MGGADLVLGNAGGGARTGASAMVRSHVMLELFGVGARGRLPSRDLLSRVEVIREVLGVGVADFPVGRETGISLQGEGKCPGELLVALGFSLGGKTLDEP